MIRVLLAEDQAMVRGALAALLTLEGDIEIVAEVRRGDEVVTVARATCNYPGSDHKPEKTRGRGSHRCSCNPPGRGVARYRDAWL
jgi:hypothetical protein